MKMYQINDVITGLQKLKQSHPIHDFYVSDDEIAGILEMSSSIDTDFSSKSGE